MQPQIMRSLYHNFPKTTKGSRCKLLRAEGLMENLTGSNSFSEFQLLSLMAKQLLRKALKLPGTKSTGIAATVMAYLAAIHFATSEHN